MKTYKNLLEIKAELGEVSVASVLEKLGDDFPKIQNMRVWLKKHPRRVDLYVKGLKYEALEKGETLLVKASSVEEVLAELEEQRGRIFQLQKDIRKSLSIKGLEA